MDRQGKRRKGGTTPPPSTRVKLSLTRLDLNTYYTTYMEGFISQFIQEAVDHVDPHTQLLPAQAQDKALIDMCT